MNLGNRMGKRKSSGKGLYFLLLALACLVGVLAVVQVILADGSAVIWGNDGMSQSYNRLVYVGEGLRGALQSFLAGGGLHLDQYSFQVGYGADIASLGVYKDPLMWLSSLCPKRYAEYLYYIFIYVRVYLAACTFSLFCFNKGRERSATFVASLCYAFCGFIVFWGILRHPGFVNAAYIFPLVLLGADRVFEGKGTTVFTLSLALGFFVTYYFCYMMCLALLVYCLLKYFMIPRARSLVDFIRLVATMVAHLALGALIACVALLPMVMRVLSLDRLGIGTIVPLLHSQAYYEGLFVNLAGGYGVGTHVFGQYVGPVVIIAVTIFIMCRKRYSQPEHKAWLVGLVLVLIAMLIPRIWSIFNGFSYVSDRWMFIAAFCMAYIVCLTIPGLCSLSKAEWIRAGILNLAIMLLMIYRVFKVNNTLPMLLLVSAYALTFFMIFAVSKSLHKRVLPLTLGSAVIACVGFASFLACAAAPLGYGYADEFFGQIGGVYKHLNESNPYNTMSEVPEENRSVYRYSLARMPDKSYRNEELNLDHNALQCYSSYYNQPISAFRKELGISDSSNANYYFGSDSRLALDAFSGAKYFIEKSGWRVPYTYNDTGISSGKYKLYETDSALPLAMYFDKAIPRSEYDQLDMVGKQEAILQGCVLNEAEIDSSRIESIVPTIASKHIEYEVVELNGAQLEEDKVVATKKNAKIRIRFSGLAKSETYLCFEDLAFDNGGQPWTYSIKVSTANGNTGFNATTPYSNFYIGKHDWALNLGYSEEPLNEATITFGLAGEYSFSLLDVVCQPVEPIVDELSDLQKSGLDEIEIGSDSISGVVHNAGDTGYVLFTYGYSPGWSAYVDGKETTIVKADTGFVAVPVLGSGNHEVRLEYGIPGLGLGAILSGIGIAVLVLEVVILKNRRKRLIQ